MNDPSLTSTKTIKKEVVYTPQVIAALPTSRACVAAINDLCQIQTTEQTEKQFAALVRLANARLHMIYKEQAEEKAMTPAQRKEKRAAIKAQKASEKLNKQTQPPAAQNKP